MRIFFAFVTLAATVAVITWIVRRIMLSQRSLDRLYGEGQQPDTADTQSSVNEMPSLTRWLFMAGLRDPQASTWFITATAAFGIVGLVAAILFVNSGLIDVMALSAGTIPGGLGDAFVPIIWTAPWLILLLLMMTPTLYVRARRRQRIQLIEQDLPITLELLSTLSEAGLGFDAALARILETRLRGRPLAAEFHSFQADLLSGRGRVDSLRRFSSRIGVPTVSIFVSALVQAEQLGMGIARVLRGQADDMRSRRRERAVAFANALPVKRLFPLVVCFLPGLFVWTLGPAFLQLIKMADTFLQTRSL